MNDLDLRAVLHRDADLVGAPSPDLLDRLARRQQHQRRQRAGLLATAAAVVLIGGGIPVALSLASHSHAAPATQTVAPTPPATTVAASTTTDAPVPSGSSPSASAEPTTAAPGTSATSTAIVTDWVRRSFHGLSFVVPADQARTDVTDLYPSGYATYEWNNPMANGAPPISIGVYAAAVFPAGVHGGQDPSDLAHPTTVRGCASAYIMSNPMPGRDDLMSTDVQCKTSTTFYSVDLTVPRTSAGEAALQTMVNSLNVP